MGFNHYYTKSLLRAYYATHLALQSTSQVVLTSVVDITTTWTSVQNRNCTQKTQACVDHQYPFLTGKVKMSIPAGVAICCLFSQHSSPLLILQTDIPLYPAHPQLLRWVLYSLWSQVIYPEIGWNQIYTRDTQSCQGY